MSYMQARSRELLRHLNIAIDDGGLGGVLHSAKSEAEGSRTLVHRAVFRHARVFSVLNDRQTNLGSQTQRVAHYGFVENGAAIVADGNCAGTLQPAKVS